MREHEDKPRKVRMARYKALGHGRHGLLAALLMTAGSLLGAVGAASQTVPVEPEPPQIRWSPERPVQGTLFVVQVLQDGEAPSSLQGQFAGEPLHFEPGQGRPWWSIAAVPVDAGEASELTLLVEWPNGRTEEWRRSVPIAPGRYAMERLTVAPEYGALSPELEARTAAEAARARQVAERAHETPRLWQPAGLQRPRPGRVTSGFGNGREFNGQVQSRHTGTDFQGAVGEPVVAPANGVVALVDQFYLGGNVVYLDHGGGLSSGYLHLSEALVARGDTVRAGDPIGKVGATGRVTGPHLHWVVRYGGVTVDPLSLLEVLQR